MRKTLIISLFVAATACGLLICLYYFLFAVPDEFSRGEPEARQVGIPDDEAISLGPGGVDRPF